MPFLTQAGTAPSCGAALSADCKGERHSKRCLEFSQRRVEPVHQIKLSASPTRGLCCQSVGLCTFMFSVSIVKVGSVSSVLFASPTGHRLRLGGTRLLQLEAPHTWNSAASARSPAHMWRFQQFPARSPRLSQGVKADGPMSRGAFRRLCPWLCLCLVGAFHDDDCEARQREVERGLGAGW